MVTAERVDPDAHGIDPEKWGPVDADELQSAALDVLEGMDQWGRIAACGKLRVFQADPTAWGDTVDDARYMAGLCRCENGWLCPPCAFSRQLETRVELEEVMEAWKADGGWIYMVTVTIPHSLAFTLDELNTVLLDAWSHLKGGRQWQEWSEQLGYAGSLRTYEVTYGHENGWHPHLHAPFFVRGKVSDEALEGFRRWALSRLNKRVQSWYRDENGQLARWPMNRKVPSWFAPVFRDLHPEHGIQVTGGQNVASYIAKMGLAREVTGFMAKEGRKVGHRTMFQVLHDYYLTQNPEDAQLFREYAKAVTGMSRWHWTPGFRAEVLGEEEDQELTEEEKLQAEAERLEADDRVVCFRVEGELWDGLAARVGHCRVSSMCIQVYNSGGLEALRHFIQSQFRWTGSSRRVLVDPDRRYLWARS